VGYFCRAALGSNWNTCNERFFSDLRTACERDLRVPIRRPVPTLRDPSRTVIVGYGPPEPIALRQCYNLASGYYAGVQAGVLLDVFNEAQGKQKRYEQWVASIRNPSFSWSQAGKIPGMACTRIHEDADPHAWGDNYLCSPGDIGMRWSQAGAISGMKCTRIHEDADPHAWGDNYLCIPQSSPTNFRWSQAGAISGMKCVRIHEDADPHAWRDNYLCW
jgi:hypothetical protein